MAKKKKNNNYVTEKTAAAKVAKEEETRKIQKQKTTKTIIISSVSVILVIGIIFGVLALAGAFDYQPTGTYDVLIDIENYGSLHVELYGDDAPETVKQFLKLADEGYYDGKTIFKRWLLVNDSVKICSNFRKEPRISHCTASDH